MATVADCYHLLVPLSDHVIDVAANVSKMELPHEELLQMLRVIRTDMLAVTNRVVSRDLPQSRAIHGPGSDEGLVVIKSLPEIKEFLQRYDDDISIMDRTIVLVGLVLQDDTTVYCMLDGYERDGRQLGANMQMRGL